MRSESYRLVLTGASGGLGHAFALALAPHSSALVLCGRDGARLDALQRRLQAAHAALQVHSVAGDLLEPAVQSRIREAASGLAGGVNLLVNAAGVNDFRAFETQDAATMAHMVGVNLLAPIQLIQHLLPLLRTASRAQIVNVGSIFGYLGYPGFALYCATKFGLRGFSQALRRELADTHVSVRYFAPRAVRTAFNSPALEDMNQALGTAQDAAEDVADALVRFLRAGAWDRRLGMAERIYVWINHLAPSVNDRAIRRQLAVIRNHLGRVPPPTIDARRSRP